MKRDRRYAGGTPFPISVHETEEDKIRNNYEFNPFHGSLKMETELRIQSTQVTQLASFDSPLVFLAYMIIALLFVPCLSLSISTLSKILSNQERIELP